MWHDPYRRLICRHILMVAALAIVCLLEWANHEHAKLAWIALTFLQMSDY